MALAQICIEPRKYVICQKCTVEEGGGARTSLLVKQDARQGRGHVGGTGWHGVATTSLTSFKSHPVKSVMTQPFVIKPYFNLISRVIR